MKQKGFTLIETVMSLALVGFLFSGLMMFGSYQAKQRADDELSATLTANKSNLLALLTSDVAWNKTVAANSPSSHLNCIGSSSGCANFTEPYDFSIYDANGSPVFSSSQAVGFNSNGTKCTSSAGTSGYSLSQNPSLGTGTASPTQSLNHACAVTLRMAWSPLCPTTDPICRYPFIHIVGTYSSPNSSVSFGKYNFELNRSSIRSSKCSSVAPACPVPPVCTSTGWVCLPQVSPTCQGLASWSDGGTGTSGCTANFPAPGIPHDTLTPSTANQTSGYTGNATFLCIPSLIANNGFVVQTGATCASAPISVSGLCGGANGGSFADATTATAAGLCSSGTLSAAISGAGPWNWSCAGSTSTASCSALPIISTVTSTQWAGGNVCFFSYTGSPSGITSCPCCPPVATYCVYGSPSCPSPGDSCSPSGSTIVSVSGVVGSIALGSGLGFTSGTASAVVMTCK